MAPPKRKKKKQASQGRIGLKVDAEEALKISQDIGEGKDVSEGILMRILDIGSACPNQNSATIKGGCKVWDGDWYLFDIDIFTFECWGGEPGITTRKLLT